MEQKKVESIEVGGHNVFPSAEDAGKKFNMWEGFDKELEIEEGKTLGDLVKEVAETEGVSEEDVLKHLEAVNKMMSGVNVSAPKFKNNKQKSKDKSKRKQAKKSRKRNR